MIDASGPSNTEPVAPMSSLPLLPDLAQYRSYVVKERNPGRRQLDLTTGAQKERCLQLGFEILDLLTERGLRDSQPRGRRRKTQLLGDDEEIAKVAKLHFDPWNDMMRL